MGFYIPVYAVEADGLQYFGAHLNPWAFNADYPSLGQVFDHVDSILNEELDDLGYDSRLLQLFYHHPQDQQFFHFWDKETQVSFEKRLPASYGRHILSKDPLLIIEISEIPNTMPHIFLETPQILPESE